jgi:response regulator RpfG family c-di-GMP phosphodiesterase
MYERRPELQERVLAGADLSLSVARQFGLTGEELEQVRRAAELRDVGTIAIPDEILLKAGPLDDEEWAFIRRHTVIGQRILSAAPACWRSRRSSASRTSGGTDSGIQTVSPASRFPSPHASSRFATPSWQ